MNSSPFCEHCGMNFQKLEELQNHRKKFCTASKYANIDSLEQQFKQTSQNKDLSMFGNMNLPLNGRTYDLNEQKQKLSNIDEEYHKILKEINEQKIHKNKVENERQMAFRQLEALEKQEEKIVIEEKKNNLDDILRRKNNLLRQEEELQKEINQYQNKKKQWEKSEAKVKEIQDFPYQQGKVAGKLGRQRNILEEKKKQLQLQMRDKKRQFDKLQKQINQTDDVLPISRASTIQYPERRPYHPPPQVPSRQITQTNNSFMKQSKRQEPFYKVESRVDNYRTPSRKSYKTQSNKSAFSAKEPSPYLKPGMFDEKDKVLKFNLNRQGKSEEDKIIQATMAQQYDDLKMLSKLPKGSELYNKKLKQYEDLSKARLQAQEKAQEIRLAKMKRQFQFEKHLIQQERQNSKWVDENRKVMVQKQMQLLNFPSLEQVQLPQQPSQKRTKISEKSKPYLQIPSEERIPEFSRPKINENKLKSSPYQPIRPQMSNRANIGYQISILQLKNYPHKKAVKVKVILYQQFYHKANPSFKYEFSTIYHDESAGSQHDPFNPNFKNKLDEYGIIMYNETFYIPENLQKIYDKNQLEMYLLIVVAEKDERKMTNEPTPYCWYSFKITHFGQLKEGRFTFNMYGDEIIYPIPADMNKMKKRKQEEITIELEEIVITEDIKNKMKKQPQIKKQPEIKKETVKSIKESSKKSDRDKISIFNQLQRQITPSIKSSKASKRSQGDKILRNYPFLIKEVEQQKLSNLKQEYFYSNQKPTQFSKITLKKPLNFDFSVAALRTLPSYIGPVKLQINFLDIDGMSVLEKQEILAEVSTDLYNPLVKFTKQVRNQSRIPPTSIIFIRIIALSALDYQIYCLGFTLFYLFMDPEGNAIISNKVTQYLMATGYYQIPIFWGNIDPRYLDLQQLLENYPTIPCSSLLIGILENSSTISNPMPDYSERKYNTILFPMDKSEAMLFSQQYKREPTDTNKIISGFLQFKGINKNYSGEQIDKYLFKTLIFNRQNTRKMFKLNWMAEYNQFFGMSLSIDELIVPQTSIKYYYFLTLCLVPPGNFYRSKSFDLHLCRKIDIDHSTTTQILFEDNQFYFDPKFDKNTSIVIECNRIRVFQQEALQAEDIEGVAYTILPLFTMGDVPDSVNVQHSEIPLVAGEFDANTVDKLENGLTWYMNKIDKQPSSPISIQLRIMNGFFMSQYKPNPFESKTPLYKTLASDLVTLSKTFEDVARILSNNYNLQIK